jgi:hypothetical protein
MFHDSTDGNGKYKFLEDAKRVDCDDGAIVVTCCSRKT